MRLGLAYEERCLEHDNGSMVLDPEAAGWIEVAHAEQPARIERACRVLAASGALESIAHLPARRAERGDLELVHSARHLDSIEEACRDGEIRWVGPEARVGPGTWDAALLSAGAGLAAVDHCLAGEGPAYALTRPPGHHASRETAMGFCLFNNVAVAAEHARRRHAVERIAIVDWDVHHGNGTQAVFYDDPDTLFVSLHQDGLYPADAGAPGERGGAAAEGANVNVPLPAGSGDACYLAAMEQVVVPAIEAFDPDLLLLSSGQDAAASDPLGRMSVTAEGFRGMTAMLSELAAERCGGRMAALQEGGYSVDHMPFCVLATVEAMAGLEPSLSGDPIELDVPDGLRPFERSAVEEARAAHVAGTGRHA